ncbi:MAG: gamma-glutamyltransferase [Thermoleophilia bacterium]|nr:gamma-glutamyltransferase [Thermoleophilia bacterium]
MKGAVAAGHPLTAEAGARALAEGGNAVDAAVAAVFVSWVTESPLTGPGGGGFMLVHRARDRSERLLDFFVAVPGQGLPVGSRAEMAVADVTFAPGNVQRFLVGGPSCGVPGAVAGVAEAHAAYGRLPWGKLVRPAVELARSGVELSPVQASLHEILGPILRWGAETRRIYGDAAAKAGERLRMEDLAATLELLAEEGPSVFYRGELARALVECVQGEGGLLTERDLDSYRVIRRVPVRTGFRGHDFVSNPPPSSGGVLIAYALRILERLGPAPRAETAAAYTQIAEVMREAARARDRTFGRGLYRGGLAARLLAEETVESAASRIVRGPGSSKPEAAGLPSTTHVSAVDEAGNAVSVSISTGAGSGVVVPGTGVHLNNMLGEEDLVSPGGRFRAPGARLTSMMSPSLVLRGGEPVLVVGSAGSARLRGAVLQIVVNAVEHGMPVGEAIRAPRIHLDGARLHLEGGVDAAVADELERSGYDVVRWAEPNVFFGGASAVAREEARLAAAGDPRRGGAGVVVA